MSTITSLGEGRTPDLSIIIPVHNARDTIPALIESALTIRDVAVEVIVVDDASTDGTSAAVAAIEDSRVHVLTSGDNLGAGGARNMAFPKAAGRYTLFFDADDDLEADALSAAVSSMDRTSADVAVLAYRYRRGEDPPSLAMNNFDRQVWAAYMTGSSERLLRLEDAPRLLGFSNYPWNKVIRTEFYQNRGLRFGETRVHNDILAHWVILLQARTILLVDRVIGTHVVEASGSNLSHTRDRKRLELFDALDATYDFLCSLPGARGRYAHHYWDFVIRVSAWARERLDPEFASEADDLLREHLLRARISDLARMRMRRNPALADAVTRRALS